MFPRNRCHTFRFVSHLKRFCRLRYKYKYYFLYRKRYFNKIYTCIIALRPERIKTSANFTVVISPHGTGINTHYMEIRPLSGTDPEIIWDGFSKAFADYEVQINRTQFLALIRRRGFDPDVSFAAFEGKDNIIAFTLNGTGTFNGIPTAYDTGTGTVKEHRGKGLATKIFEYSLPFLKERNLQQYLLEVLQHNTAAVSVYRKLGFEVTREFNYFVQKSAQLRPGTGTAGSGLSVREIDPVTAAGIEDFEDFPPSWQNSHESVCRVPDHFIALGAYEGEKMLGYCIIEPAGGDIPQFAVKKDNRRQGTGSLLFREALLLNRSEIVKIVNADINCESITGFLLSKNIPVTGKQFEMIRKL